MFVAKNFYIGTGYGKDLFEIASFDKALLMAGLSDYNLVRVSSIVPPKAEQQMSFDYPKGSVLFTAYSKNTTTREELISSAVAVGIPKNKNEIGVIMEYSCLGNKEESVSIAKKLVAEALLRRGINDFDIIANGVDAKGKKGQYTTTFAAVALL